MAFLLIHGNLSYQSWKFLIPGVFPVPDFDMHLLESATSLSGLDLFIYSDS